MKKMVSMWSKVMAVSLVLGLLGSLATAACASGPAPGPAATFAPAATVAPEAPAWRQEWERTLAEARKEGTVVIWTAAPSEARVEIGKALKEIAGINTEWAVGRTDETFEKVQRERQVGIYSVDAYYGSPGSPIRQFKPAGILAPFPPLILPEVKDPQVWFGGKLPFVDKDSSVFASALYPTQVILVNTDLVKPGEISSYQDLLAPRWKGQIAMNDPTVGIGRGWVHGVIYTKILDAEFMRALAKQEPVISRDLRLTAEWVARGKYPILVPPQPTAAAEFLSIGAPIGYVMPKEGTFLTSVMGTTVKFDRAPHPKAAQVFINWFLSKEGQKLISRLGMIDSARVDIDTSFLPPDVRKQPGVKYFMGSESEEAIQGFYNNNIKLAGEIFGHLIR